MLPMALGSSVNTWVSNSLGAGAPLAARSVFRSGMVLVVGLQALIAGSLVLSGRHIAQVRGGHVPLARGLQLPAAHTAAACARSTASAAPAHPHTPPPHTPTPAAGVLL
jgi:hypothetical protein